MPGRGAGDGRDAARRRRCSAGRGSCRPTAPPSTRARSGRRTRSRSTAPACAASARPTRRSATTCCKLLRGGVRRAPPGHAAAAARPLRRRPAMADAAAPPFRVAGQAARDRRHLDAASSSRATRGAARRSPRASSRCSTRSASGEAPISVSGIGGDGALVHTVRAVGAVTAAICAARARRRARRARAVRHGLAARARPRAATSWSSPAASACAPLRPVVHDAARRPRALRRASTLLYGGRSPAELLYRDELERWRARVDVDVDVTVDAPTADWHGRVGRRHAPDRARRLRPRSAPWR